MKESILTLAAVLGANSEAWTPDFDKMEIRNGKTGGLK